MATRVWTPDHHTLFETWTLFQHDGGVCAQSRYTCFVVVGMEEPYWAPLNCCALKSRRKLSKKSMGEYKRGTFVMVVCLHTFGHVAYFGYRVLVNAELHIAPIRTIISKNLYDACTFLVKNGLEQDVRSRQSTSFCIVLWLTDDSTAVIHVPRSVSLPTVQRQIPGQSAKRPKVQWQEACP